MAHGLVLGASGISGWSIMNQARTYPTPSTFSRITGTTNRPLSLEQALLPASDKRLCLVSGVDFTKSVDEVARLLKEKIPNVDTVTHVFYTAYVSKDDYENLKEVNTALLDTAIRAIENVAPKLESVILQTGGKAYGVEFPKDVKISPPLRESQPRIPQPWAENIFYYPQYDLLSSLATNKPWTFTEVRPDVLPGFAPGSNAMNAAQGIGLYLALFRAVHGAGAEVPFPGSQGGWTCLHTDTSQDILSRFEIYAALNREKCGNGESFNIADGKAVRWADVWPGLAQHFGLLGVAPVEQATTGEKKLESFVQKNEATWSKVAKEHGLKEEALEEQQWGFIEAVLTQFDFDRQYDLTKLREAGFTEEVDTVEGYKIAWERMRRAKILPPI